MNKILLEKLVGLQEQIEINDPQTRCNNCIHAECVGGPYIPGDTGSLICYGFGNDMGKLICPDFCSRNTMDIKEKDFDERLFLSAVNNKLNSLFEQTGKYIVNPDYEVKW